MEQALAATDKYDANKATAELSAVREVQYNAMFKPLKAFDLDPNSERLWRLDIDPSNVNAFVKKMVQLEKALRDDGHSKCLCCESLLGSDVDCRNVFTKSWME